MAQGRFYSSTAVAMTLTAPAPAGATSITVDSTIGLPIQFPYTLVLDGGEGAEEIVSVTGASGLTLTVLRGQDGTTPQDHTIGATVTHDVTARDFAEPQVHIGSSTAHGVAGSIVGTSDTQTLTNKTLTDPEIARIKRGSNFFVIPNANDQAVGRATTDTLTNKTITGGVFDVLKSNGGSATLSLPQTTDTLVGRATTDTLTNKSLTGATLDATSTIGGVSGTQVAALPKGRLTVKTNTGVASGGGGGGTVTLATTNSFAVTNGRKYKVTITIGAITQTVSGNAWLIGSSGIPTNLAWDSAINQVTYVPSTNVGFYEATFFAHATGTGNTTITADAIPLSNGNCQFANTTIVVEDIGG